MPARRIVLAAVVALAATAALAAALPKPAEFRAWTHVKSMVITDKAHGLYGFHNVYADAAAAKALKTGAAYPEGAQFAVSFYDVTTDGAMVSQGPKRMDTFMRKDASAKTTGGWAFAASGPDGKPLALDVVKGCYECHAGGAKGSDLVFSKWTE
jgi:hypothetical protein